jgi:hypothetical protein
MAGLFQHLLDLRVLLLVTLDFFAFRHEFELDARCGTEHSSKFMYMYETNFRATRNLGCGDPMVLEPVIK